MGKRWWIHFDFIPSSQNFSFKIEESGDGNSIWRNFKKLMEFKDKYIFIQKIIDTYVNEHPASANVCYKNNDMNRKPSDFEVPFVKCKKQIRSFQGQGSGIQRWPSWCFFLWRKGTCAWQEGQEARRGRRPGSSCIRSLLLGARQPESHLWAGHPREVPPPAPCPGDCVSNTSASGSVLSSDTALIVFALSFRNSGWVRASYPSCLCFF